MKKLFTILAVIAASLPVISQTNHHAINFYGNQNILRRTNLPIFDSIDTKSFTLETWINPSTTNSNGRVILAQKSYTNFYAVSVAAGKLSVFVYHPSLPNGKVTATYDNMVPADEWTHLSIVWDHANKSITTAVNADIKTPDGTTQTTSANGNSGDITVGADKEGTNHFVGTLDNILVRRGKRNICDVVRQYKRLPNPNSEPGQFIFTLFADYGNPGGDNTNYSLIVDNSGNSVHFEFNGFTKQGSTSNIVLSTAPINFSMFTNPGVTFNSTTGVLETSNNWTNTKWYDCTNQVLIAGETGTTYTPTVSGFYAIISSQSGCVDTSSCTEVTLATTSLEEQTQAIMSVYPNPTSNILFITADKEISNIQLVDMMGRVVMHKAVLSKEFSLDLSTLSSGYYTLRAVSMNGEIRSHKIVKN